MNLIEVNPCYSSFIGNIMYNYFDPANAAIEIGRRGIIKYIKNNCLYPKLTNTIIDTVVERFPESFPDLQMIKDLDNWVKLYKHLIQTGVKYRWRLCDINHKRFSKKSIKSGWKLITF